MAKKKNYKNFNNLQFLTSLELNDATFMDYLNRFKKVALSMFEWVNLPNSMDARYLERCLYFDGKASLLKDTNYGFINTRCSYNGNLNIYGLPTRLNCYSYEYNTTRTLYTGLDGLSDDRISYLETSQAILCMNDWEMIPTAPTMELFAYRLYECERTCDTNIKAQKTPVLLVGNEKQKLLLQNIYNQYDGNQPVTFGDKEILDGIRLECLKTEAPFVADKIMIYKKQIWNEALTFLGINNIIEEKKERLVEDEANSNNELINLNLQSYLAPRKEACKQFNEKFRLTGTDKEIDVRLRSDLKNIIKQAMSVVNDFKETEEIEDLKVKEM